MNGIPFLKHKLKPFQTLLSTFTIQTIDPKKGLELCTPARRGWNCKTTHQQRSNSGTPGALEGVSLTKLMMSWKSTEGRFQQIFYTSNQKHGFWFSKSWKNHAWKHPKNHRRYELFQHIFFEIQYGIFINVHLGLHSIHSKNMLENRRLKKCHLKNGPF